MLSDHPSIERWWHAMTARDSFKGHVSHHVIAKPLGA